MVKDKRGKNVGLYKESHALVIGVSNYTSGWQKLESVPYEIKRLQKTLEKLGFHVKKVMDPSCDELFDAFKVFIDDYGYDADNRLLFFFSGHGYTRKRGSRGYLVPVDAPDPRINERGFIRKSLGMAQILTWSKLIEAKHALFIFDSCFSGTIFKTRALLKHPPNISDVTSRPVRQFISAGGAGEEVPAKSVFTPLVIRALEGKGDMDIDGYVTGTELGMYLHKELLRYDTGQHPQYGKIRDPELDEGDFVFILSSSRSVNDAPSSTAQRKGRLSVKANVVGANIFLDGGYIGDTPISEVGVSVGSHRVEIKKSGYNTYRTTIEVAEGRSAAMETYLIRQENQMGRLFVDTVPSDARVRILNIGPKFKQGIMLAPGDYHVEVSANGFVKQDRWVTLFSGEDKRVVFRISGASSVSPTPSSIRKHITNSFGMTFVYIKPGTFAMGSTENESGRSDKEEQHRVILTKGFYLQTTEVTQGQWESVMGNNPSYDKECGSDCPVEEVSWYDAQDFIKKLNDKDKNGKYRLPTEAEWEYAARAGTQTPFAFGRCISTDQANYHGEESYTGCSKGVYRKAIMEVGSFQSNAWGLYDMHGNVYEWCADQYGEYPQSTVVDPTGPKTGRFRVLRGGSWIDSGKRVRSACRGWSEPAFRDRYGGFRVAQGQTTGR